MIQIEMFVSIQSGTITGYIRIVSIFYASLFVIPPQDEQLIHEPIFLIYDTLSSTHLSIIITVIIHLFLVPKNWQQLPTLV